MKKVEDLLKQVGDVRNNPANIQRTQLSALESVIHGDYDVVDPSNPFVFLLELNAVVGGAGMMRNEVLDRKRYVLQAQTPEDLYGHMSDVDFEGRFGKPGQAPFIFLMDYDEIISNAVEAENGIRKMVIPRDTEITVEGMSFTLQYPIEFRVMPHGGLRIVYDVSKPSPLHILESNVIEYELIKTPPMLGDTVDARSVMFSIDVKQFRITDFYDQLNDSSGFSKTYRIDDQFYYCRVYISTGLNGEWEEIKTTHSEQVYDPLTPTALLKVAGGSVEVKIPQIYFRRGLLGKGIRVDVYDTQGSVVVPLDRYEPRNYSADYIDRSKQSNEYADPIRSFGTLSIYSIGTVDGGRDELTFEELRQKVMVGQMNNPDLPITPAQLEVTMNSMGYNIVKDVDTITNRIYMASRALEATSGGNVSSPVAVTMQTLQTTIDELGRLETSIDNGHRITLRDGTLFEIIDGKIQVVSNDELQSILRLDPESIVQRIINRELVYIPFHYVLDATRNQFEVRAYDFNNPVVYSKQFVEENETVRLEVSTHRYGLSKTDDGYKLVITTLSGDLFKELEDDQVYAQLSFKAPGEIDQAYMLGTYLGLTEQDERMFEFNITSNFDVDNLDHLLLTSFKMYDNSERSVPTLLRDDFEITYIVSDYFVDGIEHSEMDRDKASFLLPSNTHVVIKEKLNIGFGTALKNLWRRSRTVASSIEYEQYDTDVPAVYDSIVYERDSNGLIKLVREGDQLKYSVKHAEGDPVLDGDGNPVFKYKKGDPKLDGNGEPILKSGRTVQRQMDLMLFEGGYQFVTNVSDINYVESALTQLQRWIVEDLERLNHRLLENTLMWFYPRKTLGRISVIAEDSVRTSIDNRQSFNVRFYLTEIGYNNIELRQDLSRTAIFTINQELKKSTISTMSIAEQIRSRVGDEVVDVVVSGLGGDNGYEVVTIVDDTSNLTINKNLVVLPNNNIAMQDDVTIEYTRHGK